MKCQYLHASILAVLVAGMPNTRTLAHAEARCPGNTAGVTPRIVAGVLIVVPVKIGDAGPFDFMVDTGSQLTVVDPALAAELRLHRQGTVSLVATAGYLPAHVAVLDTLGVGTQVVEKPMAAIQDLAQIQSADPKIRGVLGENFLAHFDVLIDYRRKLLCLDNSNRLQAEVQGERIPLVLPKHSEGELPFTQRLVIAVHLSGAGSRQILLQLDSGSDGPILYGDSKATPLPLLRGATLRSDPASEAQRAFALLPLQDMRVGRHTLSNIPFVTPVSTARDMPNREEDGLLPTVLFPSVFISFAENYVVFGAR